MSDQYVSPGDDPVVNAEKAERDKLLAQIKEKAPNGVYYGASLEGMKWRPVTHAAWQMGDVNDPRYLTPEQIHDAIVNCSCYYGRVPGRSKELDPDGVPCPECSSLRRLVGLGGSG